MSGSWFRPTTSCFFWASAPVAAPSVIVTNSAVASIPILRISRPSALECGQPVRDPWRGDDTTRVGDLGGTAGVAPRPGGGRRLPPPPREAPLAAAHGHHPRPPRGG